VTPHAIPARFGIPLPGIPLPTWSGVTLIIAFVIFALVGFALHGWHASVPAVEDPSSWYFFVLSLCAALVARAIWDAVILTGALKGNGVPLRLGFTGLTIDPAAWVSLDKPLAALVSLAFSPTLALLGLSGWVSEWVGAGLFMGATLSFVLHSCPLLHGPLASLLGDFRGIGDFPGHLRLAISARFLPLGQRIGGSGSAFLAMAAIALFAWAYTFTWVLDYMGAQISMTGPAAILWNGIVALVEVGWILWTLYMLIHLVRNAWSLRGQGEIEKFDAPDELVESWKTRSALLAHVPELGALKWTWYRAEARALLVKFGDTTDRHFHAIESGSARVIGRDQLGDLVHLATLREGSAFGEIALLEKRARVADVVALEPMVTASLDGKEADSLSADVRERLHQFVLATHSFDRCALFAGMGETCKERWLAQGQARHWKTGDVVIQEGAMERWLGLMVTGELHVDHQGHALAKLGVDQVVGEFGYLHADGKRQATLTALSDVMLWIWPVEFLTTEVRIAGLEKALLNLAHERERSF
jgi:CRP-like cAMP-binding protein